MKIYCLISLKLLNIDYYNKQKYINKFNSDILIVPFTNKNFLAFVKFSLVIIAILNRGRPLRDIKAMETTRVYEAIYLAEFAT